MMNFLKSIILFFTLIFSFPTLSQTDSLYSASLAKEKSEVNHFRFELLYINKYQSYYCLSYTKENSLFKRVSISFTNYLYTNSINSNFGIGKYLILAKKVSLESYILINFETAFIGTTTAKVNSNEIRIGPGIGTFSVINVKVGQKFDLGIGFNSGWNYFFNANKIEYYIDNSGNLIVKYPLKLGGVLHFIPTLSLKLKI